jgi:hypothetical protein
MRWLLEVRMSQESAELIRCTRFVLKSREAACPSPTTEYIRVNRWPPDAAAGTVNCLTGGTSSWTSVIPADAVDGEEGESQCLAAVGEWKDPDGIANKGSARCL